MTAEEWLTFGVVYLTLCGLVAWFGESRGHDPVTWFGFAVLGSPLLAFLVALFRRGAKVPSPQDETTEADER